jgi:hypothetical protein
MYFLFLMAAFDYSRNIFEALKEYEDIVKEFLDNLTTHCKQIFITFNSILGFDIY